MRHRLALLILLVCVTGAYCAEAPADASPPAVSTASPGSALPTIAAVDAKLKELEAADGMEEVLKATLLEYYRKALTHLKAAEGYTANAAKYREALARAPEAIARRRADLERPPVSVSVALPPAASAKELEPYLARARAELSGVTNTLGELEKQIAQLEARPEAAQKQLSEAKSAQEALDESLAVEPPADEKPAVREARTTALGAERVARAAEAEMLAQELLSHKPRLELAQLARDLKIRERTARQVAAKTVEDAIGRQRRREAEAARLEAEQAQREAAGEHPALVELADRNAEVTEDLARLVAGLEQTTARRARMAEALAQLEKDYKNLGQKLDLAGLSGALAENLRKQRKSLPDLRRYRRDAELRDTEISRTLLAQLELEEQRKGLADMDRAVREFLDARVDAALPALKREEIAQKAAALLAQRQKVLDDLINNQAAYKRALDDLDALQGEFVKQAEKYASFLDERLLWIPNASPLGRRTLDGLPGTAAWLGDPGTWTDVARELAAAAGRLPVGTALF